MNDDCPLCDSPIGIGRRYYLRGGLKVHCSCHDDQMRRVLLGRYQSALLAVQDLLDASDHAIAAEGRAEDALDIVRAALRKE